MFKLSIILLLCVNIFSLEFYYERGQRVELTPLTNYKTTSKLSTSKDTNKTIRYYQKTNSQIVGVADTIVAKCSVVDGCEKVMQKYDTLEFEIISNDIYLIKITNQMDIFDISRSLYEEGCFSYVHPNFYKEKKLR